MPADRAQRYDWLRRLKDSEERYRTARWALGVARRGVAEGRIGTTEEVTVAAVDRVLRESEDVYLVQLFAVFEEACRRCLGDHHGRDPHIRTRDLIDTLAARWSVTGEVRRRVHEIREYRNRLIHSGDDQPALEYGTARTNLSRFLGCAPDAW